MSKKSEILKHLEEGMIVEGQIKKIADYGAFIDLGGLEALLLIVEMSWERIRHPSELFKVGDSIQVKVSKIDRDNERVSLSYKDLLPDPLPAWMERFPLGSRVIGKVVSLPNFGAFIEIEPGIVGLVHLSEMSWSKHILHPSQLLSVGQEVEGILLEVCPTRRRISLSIKQIEPNP